MRRILFSLVLLTAFALPLTAQADTIDDFVLTGGGNVITFSLPSPYPTFESIGAGGVDGGFSAIAQGELNRQPTNFAMQFISPFLFYVGPGISIGFGNFGSGSLTVVGALLYSGPSGDHTFLTGTYDLHSFGFLIPPVPYTLTITPETSTAATPEPSTFVLLGTGMFGAIATARRRRLAANT